MSYDKRQAFSTCMHAKTHSPARRQSLCHILFKLALIKAPPGSGAANFPGIGSSSADSGKGKKGRKKNPKKTTKKTSNERAVFLESVLQLTGLPFYLTAPDFRAGSSSRCLFDFGHQRAPGQGGGGGGGGGGGRGET